ncbi:KRAB-A domain-containing protein 2-like [Argiope bruennichi]|uniref:KRAB-A domain-containing protein 2-like n=1 Tax=Argiope bruennichi TaxID=94029 RepID=UPI002495302A|nr:KRAB-A domain-containing protein 2-like [Argiope bruennichi]
MNSRCQLDLIDLQSQADNEFKFIMVYQDHLTKSVLLRPLQSKRAKEVALQVLHIFLIFEAPCILQSDNGREFVNSVIEQLRTYWPELKSLHGKPRHSQSQGSVERANQDVENMLTSWMKDNKTTKWSYDLRFVQFMKNRAILSRIKQSPYKPMFGIEPRVRMTTSTLLSDIIKSIEDEDDLQKIFEDMKTEEQETEQAQSGEHISEFNVSQKISLTKEQVPNQEISLRTTARKGAVGTGQGFYHCSSKRCFCMKNDSLCNSKCYSSLPCRMALRRIMTQYFRLAESAEEYIRGSSQGQGARYG